MMAADVAASRWVRMAVAADSAYSLWRLLGMVRSGAAVTLPELVVRSGLGRKLVTQRLGELLACGLRVTRHRGSERASPSATQ